ncbi:MAG: hypothetical protein DMG39_11965 [Acidobacteria bacterium]|nr:MAG: hypothetical protein DMG39_11965 [Acidobacteriota bacterium]
MRKVSFIRRIAPWILKDFRSPRRQLASVQDGFNRKGLISNNGEKRRLTSFCSSSTARSRTTMMSA